MREQGDELLDVDDQEIAGWTLHKVGQTFKLKTPQNQMQKAQAQTRDALAYGWFRGVILSRSSGIEHTVIR